MEIINYFIAFIIGALFTLIVFFINAIIEDKKPKNKVHFYVTCGLDSCGYIIYALWLGSPTYTEDKNFVSNTWCRLLAVNSCFNFYNLNYTDFEDMKQGEIREVFLNL